MYTDFGHSNKYQGGWRPVVSGRVMHKSTFKLKGSFFLALESKQAHIATN